LTVKVSRAPLPDGGEQLCNYFAPGSCAEIAFAVDADADGISFHVAFSDYEHGVDLHLLGALDFAVNLVGALIDFGADLMRV
jgi:hypothetical protein